MADHSKKTYVLTIEYSDTEDQIEYIQEEIIEPSELQESRVITELTEEDYWDKDSIEILRKFYTGEIGES
tara:strand:- start:1453 stop:1662 length:210 start_codon:yes stop_codon:yes gene_type:complete